VLVTSAFSCSRRRCRVLPPPALPLSPDFGIGSILTPLVAWQYGMKEAVVLVSIPHFAATLWRFLAIAKTRSIGESFSASASSMPPALWAERCCTNAASSPALAVTLALLLILVGLITMLGYSGRLRFRRPPGAWIAGAVSGAFGGMVGNQGGLRGAAMLGLGVRKEAFVATATAIGLMVDTVRMPVYFFRNAQLVLERWLLGGHRRGPLYWRAPSWAAGS